MPSNTIINESRLGTTVRAAKERHVRRSRSVGEHVQPAHPKGIRPPSDAHSIEAAPTEQTDNDAVQTPSGLGHQRFRANMLGLLGLAAVAGGGWAAAAMGDLDFIREFISQPSGFINYSASGPTYAPWVTSLFGLAFSGPYGMIFAGSLGICACLGMKALRADRGAKGLLGKAVPLLAALLMPLLVLNYTILLAVEKVGAYLMPASLLDNPSRLGVWVIVTMIGGAVISLTFNLLTLRWAWRRERRLSGMGFEQMAV